MSIGILERRAGWVWLKWSSPLVSLVARPYAAERVTDAEIADRLGMEPARVRQLVQSARRLIQRSQEGPRGPRHLGLEPARTRGRKRREEERRFGGALGERYGVVV